MLYTIIGAILLSLIVYWFANIFGVENKGSFYPSKMEFLIMASILVGGGIGFGVGVTRFLSGTYFKFF